MKYGMLNVKKALVSGNYYKPTGVYYGGNTLTNAARNLNAIARDVINVQKAHLNASTRLNDQQEGIIIDVHTGLGDSGVDTIVSDLPVDEDMFEELWPTGIG